MGALASTPSGCRLRAAGKTKLHILIAAAEDRSLAFFINTRPAPFVARDPDLAARQVFISKQLHPFLAHDSCIACEDAARLPSRRELASKIVDGDIKVLGHLHRSLYPQVMAATAGSPLIAERDAALIVVAFGP